MPKRKNKTKKIYKTKDGFADIPKTLKTVWRTDQFGKRKVLNIGKHTSRIHVDNKGLATDYPKKSEKYKQVKNEYERRLLLQLKENASSRRLFKKKTRKKYNSKTIEKKINKMSANKLQNLYYFLLEKDKSRKK
jgi:hypothetical protein|tara:strand:- start:31 stop:432 length:402 start_codon:yes stop_codon:yes gene_type:complete